MSLFPIHRYRVLDDPFDRFFGDQLDFFDPWYDFDTFPSALTSRSNAFRWINQPQSLTHSSSNNTNHDGRSLRPATSEKFRVQVNVAGFNPETIQTKIEGRKVIVEAKQEDRENNDDFHMRHMRKTYELPEHADVNHMTSYVTPNNILVIEVPIHNPEKERQLTEAKNDQNQSLTQFGQYRDPLFDYVSFLAGSDFQPRIVDKSNNEKQLEMAVDVKNYKPEEIKVSIKNNQLTVQAEHKHEDKNRSERSYFFKSTTLPLGTQVEQLKSQLTNDGQLKIEAPFVEPKQNDKAIEARKQ